MGNAGLQSSPGGPLGVRLSHQGRSARRCGGLAFERKLAVIEPAGRAPFRSKSGKAAQFQRKYNRDYHAIIINDRLASIYETYIKRDFELASAQAEGPESFAAPDLFVPEEEI
jgi:hypothetical protein